MKSVVKKVLIIAFVTLLVLTGTLVIHIAMVSKKPVYDNAHIQMSRIDLAAPIDSTNKVILSKNAKEIKAINRYIINTKSNNILVTYDRRLLSGKDLHNKISKGMSITTSLYIPSAESLKNGCPIIDKESITYKIGHWIEKLF